MRGIKSAEKYGKAFGEMSQGQKREYIWEYYRWHIVCGIIGVVLLFGVFNRYILNPPPKVFASVAFYGEEVNNEFMLAFADDLDESLNIDGKKLAVEAGGTWRDKFYMQIAAKELDIVIAPSAAFGSLVNNSSLRNLTEVFDEQAITEMAGSIHYDIVKHRSADGEIILGDEQPFGISMDGTEFFEAYGVDSNNWVLGFVNNAPRMENAKRVFYEIYSR